MPRRYAPVVIGAVTDLRFTVTDSSKGRLVDLEAVGAQIVCKLVDDLGDTVSEGLCAFSGTLGWYRWNTAGRGAGVHRGQLTIVSGADPSPKIESSFEIELVERLPAADVVDPGDDVLNFGGLPLYFGGLPLRFGAV